MIALIAAIDQQNCIGKDGTLPWHIPEDLAHFKKLTEGKTVLMGRKTWESLPEKYRPLPNRTNIVITRQNDYALPAGVERYDAVDAALVAHLNEDIMIIGGGEIFTQTIDRADTLYITNVNQTVTACTAFFPPIDLTLWHETERDDRDGFSFVTYKRKNTDSNADKHGV
ncbi:dihydrofolate reductase [Candidatus Uhrbacteria bacterium]|nr:dihydrofolate reductase [Candidatus Uhrbacteria bacterium]